MTHQRFRESKFQVEMASPNGFKAKPDRSVIPSCYARKCDKVASFWLISPETGPETFREAQIAQIAM